MDIDEDTWNKTITVRFPSQEKEAANISFHDTNPISREAMPTTTVVTNKPLSSVYKASTNTAFHTQEKYLDDSSLTRYGLSEKVGVGGVGTVWKAHDNNLKRDVAIKSYSTNYLECKREINIAGNLHQTGIPTLYDVSVNEHGEYYSTFQFIEGRTLYTIIKGLKEGNKELHQEFPFSCRINIMMQLARILKSIHEKRIIHRDIKPANIMIDGAGNVFLIDWNIALHMDEETGEGEVCGTLGYMSPEQARGEELDQRSDLFSFASVFYEFLALTPIRKNTRSLSAFLSMLASESFPYYSAITHPAQPLPPPEYYDIIHKNLEANKNNRHDTAQQILERLYSIQEGHFRVTCPRTKVRKAGQHLFLWIDQNPLHNMRILYLFMLGMALLFLFLGGIIGSIFFSYTT